MYIAKEPRGRYNNIIYSYNTEGPRATRKVQPTRRGGYGLYTGPQVKKAQCIRTANITKIPCEGEIEAVFSSFYQLHSLSVLQVMCDTRVYLQQDVTVPQPLVVGLAPGRHLKSILK